MAADPHPEFDARDRQLFDEVVELDPDARARALDRECADSPRLRERLEQLLSPHGLQPRRRRRVMEFINFGANRATTGSSEPSILSANSWADVSMFLRSWLTFATALPSAASRSR